MKRVMVIGAPGSGKSTLGRAIGTALGLPVVHLDRVFWLPGWVERSRADCVRLAHAAEAAESWVIEGNFRTTWDTRVARADLVVWLDLPLGLRLRRILGRWAEWRGRSRPDMQEGCPERLDPAFLWYVVSTARRSRRHSAALLAGPARGKSVRLESFAAIAAWQAALEAQQRAP